MPNQSDGDLLHTMASYGLSHVRTKLRHLPVIPFLTPHPIEADGELACHRHLGDRAVATHRQVQEVTSPLGVEADDGLRRLHQQETEQSVPLLADMSQPLAIGTGVLAGSQPQIAADLLAAPEPAPETQ